MSARLSIVIPTRNAAADLPATLMALMPGVEAAVIRDLIIVDARSNDATLVIAQDAGATVVQAAPSRGGQLRAGAAAARGDWLLFLHADTHLPRDWPAFVAGRFAMPDRAACFRLAFRADGFGARWTAGWANLRTHLFGLPYGDQGLLISRNLYTQVG
ncbi:MAG: glycosyltransferase, partial [Pseudomonadota bacterium]